MFAFDFARAATKPKTLREGQTLPNRVVRGPLTYTADDLRGYCALVAHEDLTVMPLLWPQVKAAGLHLQLFTASDFPLSPLGMVHVSNHSEHFAVLKADQPLEAECDCTLQGPGMGGLLLRLQTRAFAKGSTECVALYQATILVRAPRRAGEKRDGAKRDEPVDPRVWQPVQPVDAPANLGRRYARVSKDFNPIHLSAVSAKLFGFKRAIAHGMWSLARLAATAPQTGPMHLDGQFKRPVLLPARAVLERADSGDLRLRDERSATVFVEATVHPR